MTELEWEGCTNVRDLGGLPTEDGGETRQRAVVRADSVRSLTPAGWASLVAYGVTRIVDLRWHEELELDEPADLPVEIVHVPLFGRVDRGYGLELAARLDATEDTAEYFAWSYSDFLERFHANFGTAVAAVAEASGPTVVHCAAGKDRTGLVSALLLRLAGVPIDAVAADYALSDASLLPGHQEWLDGAPSASERRRRVRRSAAPGEAMAAVLEGLDRRYGAARAYLLEAGVTAEQLDALRARLLGSSG